MMFARPAGSPKVICGFFYHLPAAYGHCYLPQLSLSAHCKIVASTARTVLTQTFTNNSDGTIPELQYNFPIYDGVSVVGFTCTVNNERVIRGVVKEKSEARDTYEKARDRGETAGLLENLPQAADVFTTSIANVPAGAHLKVEIVYVGELKHDAEVDGIRYTIPTAIAPRYGSYPGELQNARNLPATGGIKVVVDAEMPAGSNIQRVSSPSHLISVTLGNTSAGHAAGAEMSLQKASATLSLGEAELDKDFVLHVAATKSGDPIAVLETHPELPNQRALMATLVPRFSLPPMRPEVVFICDRSGSMQASIPGLKEALHIFLKSLPVGVKFNICSFGSRHELLFKKGSQTYDSTSLAKATKYVNDFEANFGGTQMYQPVKEVMEKRFTDMPLQVILLTDGEIWDQEKLISLVGERVKDSDGEIRVFTLGIGNGVSHSLIEGVARAGNGFSQVVGQDEKMNTKVVRMLRASLTPLVKDYTLELKYAPNDAPQPQPQPQQQDDAEDGFEIVEKVMDCLTLDVPESASSTGDSAQAPSGSEPPKQPISLFDPAADPDVEMKDASQDASAGGKYADVPPVPEPKLLQAPFQIPPLYPFNRTSVYLLLSPETTQRTPKSVVLRGTSIHGPLELEIPVSAVDTPRSGEDASSPTIHQLAARAAIRDLETGLGWLHYARDAAGTLLKDEHPGRFSDMVEREAVRLGVAYQVANKWCSFVAVEATEGAKEVERHAAIFVPDPHAAQVAQDQAAKAARAQAMLAAAGSGVVDRYRRLPAAMSPMSGRAAARSDSVDRTERDRSVTRIQQPSSFSAAPMQMMQRSGPPRAPLSADPSHVLPPPPPPSQPRPAPVINTFSAHAPPASGTRALLPPGTESKASFSMSRPVLQASSGELLFGAPAPSTKGKRPSGAFDETRTEQAVEAKKKKKKQIITRGESEDEDEDEDEDESDGDNIANFRWDPVEHGSSEPVGSAPNAQSGFNAIVARQSFEGAWTWSDGLFAALGIDAAALLRAAGEELGPGELSGASDALATAVVLAFLESRLSARREEWEMLAEKAELWLDGNVPGGKMPRKDYAAAVAKALAKV